MKTKFFMMGILCFTLVFGFIGCDDSGDDKPSPPSGITPPSVGSLPDLPEGEDVTAVTADDAEALLDAVKSSGISRTISDAIDTVIGQPPDGDHDKWTYDFKDKESSDQSLKVSAKQAQTIKTDIPLDENGRPTSLKNGQYYKFSYENSTKAVIAAENGISSSDNSITALKGSSFQSINTQSSDAKVTDANKANSNTMEGISGTQSSLEQYVIAFTVKTSDSKAGKVVLDAKESQSITYPTTTASNPPYTYSGSLKVYGANDAVVKTINITDLTTADSALDYFGLRFGNHGDGGDYESD